MTFTAERLADLRARIAALIDEATYDRNEDRVDEQQVILAVEQLVEPGSVDLVLLGALPERVHQRVDVGKDDHRRPSASSAAASASLSSRSTRSRPCGFPSVGGGGRLRACCSFVRRSRNADHQPVSGIATCFDT
ncbi:MAG: hypothetical protein ACR2JG_13075 [Geodermatophilaceae bacterium]